MSRFTKAAIDQKESLMTLQEIIDRADLHNFKIVEVTETAIKLSDLPPSPRKAYRTTDITEIQAIRDELRKLMKSDESQKYKTTGDEAPDSTDITEIQAIRDELRNLMNSDESQKYKTTGDVAPDSAEAPWTVDDGYSKNGYIKIGAREVAVSYMVDSKQKEYWYVYPWFRRMQDVTTWLADLDLRRREWFYFVDSNRDELNAYLAEIVLVHDLANVDFGAYLTAHNIARRAR